MRAHILLVLLGFALTSGVGRLWAQEIEAGVAPEPIPRPGEPPTVQYGDRIMAVVGNTILLESEWTEQSALLAEQFRVSPTSEAFSEIAEEAFEQMVRNMIIVTAAERDTTIQLDQDLIAEETEREIDRVRERFGSEEEFRQEIRRSQWGSLTAYRADIQDRKRRELLGQVFLEAKREEIQPVPVSEDEVREFWEANRAAFGRRPETFLFEEVAVAISPSDAARDRARVEAEEVLAEIMEGRDFGAAAREHSGDPGSAEEGGDLGWFGRGRMVGPFEEAAFEAAIGEIVGPIETPFGYHLLQVIDQRSEERRARHILIAYERTADDRERAQSEAISLRDRIEVGADVDSLQAVYMPGDSAAAEVLELSRGQLPPVYADALQSIETGEATVVETTTGYSVVISRGRGGGEEIEFEEVSPRIRQQLATERAEEAFVERLKGRVYVEIRVTPQQALAGG